MRTLYLLVVINVVLILSSCATNHYPATPVEPAPETAPECHHHKDPVAVSFLKTGTFSRPYTVLGKTEVSRFNTVGIKRQEATIRDLMREQAASLDGDAIIDMKHDDKMITATVIAYQKTLA